MVTTVYLVRHAQAEGNEKRLFQGHYNGAVSQMGWRQLEQLAEYAKTLPLEAVYSSPLTRAMETAKAVARYHDGLTVQVREGLIEINGGDWEGKPWDCFPTDYPEEMSTGKIPLGCFRRRTVSRCRRCTGGLSMP